MGLVIWRKILYSYMMSVFLYILSHAEAAQIRLVGSSSRCSGRVEIYHNNRWGTICDDSWDLNDAEVVCRELNCGRAQSAPGGAYFGRGNDPILLENMGCLGSERSLTECPHRGFDRHNCDHGEDAGVVCTGYRLPVIGTVVALLLLLLLLLIHRWLMLRRKFRKPTANTDPTISVMDIEGRDDDEEDEEVYVNAEVSTCHQGTDDDSDVYEKPDCMAVSNMHKHVCNPDEENDAPSFMSPERSTKEHPNPGRRPVEGQSDGEEDYVAMHASDEHEQDNVYANTDMSPESSTKEHLSPGRGSVAKQSGVVDKEDNYIAFEPCDEDEEDNIYANC